MENASKALIIAGAILLAIVLVSLGVLVINNARKDITGDNMDEAKIGAFNKNIAAYCGKHKTGTDMNNLIRAIISSNATQMQKSETHIVEFSTLNCANGAEKQYDYTKHNIEQALKTGGTGITALTFSNSYKYTALYQTDANGYICRVEITSE